MSIKQVLGSNPEVPSAKPAPAQPVETAVERVKSRFFASDSDSSSDNSPPATPTKGEKPAPTLAGRAALKGKFFDSDSEEDPSESLPATPKKALGSRFFAGPDEDDSPPSSPTSVEKPDPTTPVSKFINEISLQTPNHTLTPESKQLQTDALKRIESLSPAEREIALRGLADIGRRGLENAKDATVIPGSGNVFGVEGLKTEASSWPVQLVQKANQRSRNPRRQLITFFDASHTTGLEKTEGGLSVKGMHLHAEYFPDACIHPITGVWCGTQQIDMEGVERKSKFSTFFPLQIKTSHDVTQLVSAAWDQGDIIAQKEGLFLIQLKNSPLMIELPFHNNTTIPTAFPILDYAVYDENKVFTYDQMVNGNRVAGAISIRLGDVRPLINLKQKPDALRYTCDNGDLIIDVAHFLGACPIKKGILVRFPRAILV